MSFERIASQPVTIVHAPYVTDEYGNEQKDWGNATRTEALGWLTQEERFSDERDVDRELSTSTWRLLLRPDAVVSSADRVETEDGTFEVFGRPARARRPGRGVHHIECELKLVE